MKLYFCSSVPHKNHSKDYRYNNKLYIGIVKKFSVSFVVREADPKRKLNVQIDLWTNINNENKDWHPIPMHHFIKFNNQFVCDIFGDIIYDCYRIFLPNKFGEFECTFRGRTKYDDDDNWSDWTWYNYQVGFENNIKLYVWEHPRYKQELCQCRESPSQYICLDCDQEYCQFCL